MEKMDGMQNEPIEGVNESLHNATGDVEADLEEAIQEATGQAITEGIKDAVRDALLEEGHTEEKADTLADKGTEMLEREPSEYREPPQEQEPKPELPQKIGSEGSLKPYNYPTEPGKARQNVPWPSGKNTTEITKRERLEAMAEGLEEFVAQPHKTQHQEEATLEKIEEIKQELETLPPDPPEKEDTEIEDMNDEEAQADGWADAAQRKAWLEGTASHGRMLKNIPKAAKLQMIKDIYSIGLEHKGKLGYEGLGALMDDWDEQKHDMGTMFD